MSKLDPSVEPEESHIEPISFAEEQAEPAGLPYK